MTVLPIELIIEILSWVPSIKSLYRFKCVCKVWKSLLSDPSFVTLHLERASSQISSNHLMLQLQPPTMMSVTSHSLSTIVSCSSMPMPASFPVQHEHVILKSNYRVVGSCNGLICLLRSYENKCCVRLWNPELRLKSKKSPPVPVDRDGGSNTYKVVAAFNDAMIPGATTCRAKVYTMMGNDHCWNSIQTPFPAFPVTDGYYHSGSGTLNWLACRKFGSTFERLSNLSIVSLDLGNETYKQFFLPVIIEPYGENYFVFPSFGILGDCLSFSYEYRRTQFIVWQMKEFGIHESWTQCLNDAYNQLHILEPSHQFKLQPVCMSKKHDFLILLCIHYYPGHDAEIIIYYWANQRVERHQICSNRVWVKDHVRSWIVPR